MFFDESNPSVQHLLQQAQKMQQDLLEAQEILENRIYRRVRLKVRHNFRLQLDIVY